MAKGIRERSSSSRPPARVISTRPPEQAQHAEKMLIKKFDPVARKHVDYKETKLK